MNLKRSLFFLGCSYMYCQFCFCGINAESGSYNIAQGKPTQQGPKDYCDPGNTCHPSRLAVDDDLGQNVQAGDCTHTVSTSRYQGSWWSVDFLGNFYLSYIRILRRHDVDCCLYDRMRGITITDLSSSHNIYSADDAGVFNYKTDVNITIPEELKDAQFSGIKMTVSGPYLTLCEVQVFLAKHCGAIIQVPNGYWSPLSSNQSTNCLYYGCSYELICNSGYTKSEFGSTTITCDENGQWTNLSGYCQAIQCPLEINTRVNYTIANHQEKYTYNDTLTAKCIDGHELSSGNLSRSCLESGTWSGSEPVCTIVVCQRPDEDPLLIFKLNSSSSSFYYGTFIQTACVRGYKHTSGNLTRQCQENKTWSASPVCEALQCSAPSLVANGGYFQISTNGTEEEVLSSPIKFALDTRVHFKCNDGFALSYPCRATRVCLEDETWSEEEPKCNEISSSNDNQLGSNSGLTALTGGIIGAGTVLLLMLIAAAVFLLLRRMRNQWHTDSAYESTVNADEQRRYSTLVKTDKGPSDNGEPKVVPDKAPDNDVEMYEEIGGKKMNGNFKV